MSQSRQLAAIMFTDIVGYTALMGEDEQAAFELLKKNRSVQRPLIEKFNGRWLKEIGDGVLASFSTVSDAVNCAKEIQQVCQDHPDLSLRIGIHQGEVVFEGDDVFGDGVNIASRLEPLAPIGGILVSESVYRNLGNKQGIETLFVREESLKNVKDPIKTYEVRVEGIESPEPMITTVEPPVPKVEDSISFNARKLRFTSLAIIIVLVLAYFLYSRQGGDETQPIQPEVIAKSIAVIPFDNESSDEENEYFINGMTEDIRNNLSKISDLRVISKTSSEKYRGTALPSTEIGQELEVTYILEGTAQKIGSQVKIHAQLIKTETDDHIWSQTYVRDITEVFQVQSEIAEKVASELEITLTLEDQQLINTAPTKNLIAYDFYLQAKELSSNWRINRNLKDFETADSLYKRAEKEDPLFVGPLVGRANLYISANNTIELVEIYPIDSALVLLDKALTIDPSYAKAYAVRASYFDRIGEKRKAFFDQQKAIQLNPNDPATTLKLGNQEFSSQNYIVGLQLAHRGLRLLGNEVSIWSLHSMGFMYLELYDLEEAIYNWDQMGSIKKDASFDLLTRVHLYDYLEQWEVSHDLIKKHNSLYPEQERVRLGALGMHLATKKEFEQALYYFKEANQLPYNGGGWDEGLLERNLYQGIALYETGQVMEGLEMLNDCLSSHSEKKGHNNVFDQEVIIAGIHAFLGNKEQAYNWLRKSDWRSFGLFYVQQDVIFSNINQEKEFQDLVGSVMEERKKIREEISQLKAVMN